MTLRVLSVASEMYPVMKTGGLADVVGALPAALRAQDVDMRTLVPGYPPVLAQLASPETVWSEQGFFGGDARILAGHAGGAALFVLDAPHLFARAGNPYTMPDGRDWPDNPQRFAALAFAGAALAQLSGGFEPDVVHAHDWQTGLVPAYLALSGRARPATVLTIHNLAFQGQVPASLLAELRLPPDSYTPDGVEYYQSIGMLKAGVRYADRVTTVSPTYAEEIRTPDGGMGMDGLLRARGAALSGILNGIDTQVWDPEWDAHLPVPFGVGRMDGRWASRAAVQARFGLAPERTAPIFGVVSRLSHQKGLDLLLECVPDLIEAGAQLALIGSGDAGLQAAFADVAAKHPGRIGVEFGYDEAGAHVLQAGADAILVPSRFEPCGLTQLCALRYGAIPVVSRVGGLADTVIDANEAGLAADVATGVQFLPVSAAGLRAAILRTVALWWLPEVWAGMQVRGMRSDVGWETAGRKYAALYRDVVRGR